jgi:hypothetical protein
VSATIESPSISVRRIRATAIEHRRRPVAHSAQTMRDSYLMPNTSVQEQSRQVVVAALDAEVDKARSHHGVAVFSSTFVRLIHQDPAAAARAADLSPEQVVGLTTGAQDTAVASCIDHTTSPYDPPGQPCSASFLACLDCPNARALPHQLPVQLAAIDALHAMRPHLDPRLWSARYAPRLAQLHDITAAFHPAELADARAAITTEHHRRVSELLEGRWDLR